MAGLLTLLGIIALVPVLCLLLVVIGACILAIKERKE